ncbi:hypothetical protein ACFL1B_04290 [Nanoarchaeota archaeon]
MRLIIIMAALILFAGLASAATINCTIYMSTGCPADYTKLLGMESLTDQVDNAHVQNATIDTYNFSVCCISLTAGRNLTDNCGTTFLRLSATSNAHAQQSQLSDYTELACIGATKGNITCAYPQNSCISQQDCLVSMISSESSNTTNAHVGNCTTYSTKVCCGFGNGIPSQVTLIYPINDTTITNRTPRFNWTISSDPDSDPITYRIQVALDSSFSSIVINQEITDSNYTSPYPLDFDQFFWRVYANDTINASLSTTENFTVSSVVEINLTVRNTDFGELAPLGTNDTTNDVPNALQVENLGNVETNVSINATQLFSKAALGTSAYQYKVDELSGEEGSYDASGSTTSFANMPTASTLFIDKLNWTGSIDEAEIDIRVIVPGDEPVGEKLSTIEIAGGIG